MTIFTSSSDFSSISVNDYILDFGSVVEVVSIDNDFVTVKVMLSGDTMQIPETIQFPV